MSASQFETDTINEHENGSFLPEGWEEIFAGALEVLAEHPEHFSGSDNGVDEAKATYYENTTRLTRRQSAAAAGSNIERVTFLAIAAFYADDEPASSIYKVIRPLLAAGPQYDQTVGAWAETVSDSVNDVRSFVQSCNEVGDRTATVATDKNTRYMLMDLLTSSDERVSNFSEALYFDDVSRGEKGLPSLLLGELNRGEYDNELLEDMFTQVISQESDSSNLRAVEKLWKLSQIISPDMQRDVMVERLIAAKEHLPGDVVATLTERRKYIADILDEKIQVAKTEWQQLGIDMGPEEALHRFSSTVNSVILAQSRVAGGAPGTYSGGYSKAQVMQARAEEKRRRKEATPKLPEEVAVLELVKPPLERELQTVNRASGERFSQDSPQFQALVDHYVDSHRGAVTLRDDVTRMLQYLSTMDLATGLVKGLKKYNTTIWIGDKEEAVYAFKPADAPGLSSGSQIARKTRIFCTLSEQAVGVLAIVDRDQVVTTERNFGFTSRTGASR